MIKAGITPVTARMLRLVAATALLVAAVAVPLRALPAAADSFGRAVMALHLKAGGSDVFSGQSVTYGTPIAVEAWLRDVSDSCSPIEFSCDPPRGTVELIDNGALIASGQLQPIPHKESAGHA